MRFRLALKRANRLLIARSIYVSQTTSAARKPSKRQRTDDSQAGSDEAEDNVSNRVHALLRFLFVRSTSPSFTTYESPSFTADDGTHPPKANKSEARQSYLSYLPAPSTSLEEQLSTTGARLEFAQELIDSYFSIVHPRFPLLNPETFRSQHLCNKSHQGPTSVDVHGLSDGLSEPLLAMVLLWGAKFSNHAVIASDRKECAEALREREKSKGLGRKRKSEAFVSEDSDVFPKRLREQGVNRIAEHIYHRASELFESKRVFHNPSFNNVVSCLLMQHYVLSWPRHASKTCFDADVSMIQIVCKSTDGCWLRTAIEHMQRLGYDSQESINQIPDAEMRRSIGLAWLMGVTGDAYSALLYRTQPRLRYDEYTTEPPCAIPSSFVNAPNPSGNEAGHS